MINWREIVSYPETFSIKEAAFLDETDETIFLILLGELSPKTNEEKKTFVNCTKSIPSSDCERALAKFHIQSKKRKQVLDSADTTAKIDYNKLASGGSHGDRKTRLGEQKKDRYGKAY
jgi:uncharacterized protein YifE (UPF0438 family)